MPILFGGLLIIGMRVVRFRPGMSSIFVLCPKGTFAPWSRVCWGLSTASFANNVGFRICGRMATSFGVRAQRLEALVRRFRRRKGLGFRVCQVGGL